jgi:hypothetical protein
MEWSSCEQVGQWGAKADQEAASDARRATGYRIFGVQQQKGHEAHGPGPGLTGLLVITERALGAKTSRIVCSNDCVEYKFVSMRPLSLKFSRQRSLDVAISMLSLSLHSQQFFKYSDALMIFLYEPVSFRDDELLYAKDSFSHISH